MRDFATARRLTFHLALLAPLLGTVAIFGIGCEDVAPTTRGFHWRGGGWALATAFDSIPPYIPTGTFRHPQAAKARLGGGQELWLVWDQRRSLWDPDLFVRRKDSTVSVGRFKSLYKQMGFEGVTVERSYVPTMDHGFAEVGLGTGREVRLEFVHYDTEYQPHKYREEVTYRLGWPLHVDTSGAEDWSLVRQDSTVKVFVNPHSVKSVGKVSACGWFRIEFLDEGTRRLRSLLLPPDEDSSGATIKARPEYQGECVLIKVDLNRHEFWITRKMLYSRVSAAEITREAALTAGLPTFLESEARKVKPGTIQETFYDTLLRQSTQQATP